MALFKTFRGKRTDLDHVTKVDGHAYFCTDDGSFWIDHQEAEGVIRTQINKQDWTDDIREAIDQLKGNLDQDFFNSLYNNVCSFVNSILAICYL